MFWQVGVDAYSFVEKNLKCRRARREAIFGGGDLLRTLLGQEWLRRHLKMDPGICWDATSLVRVSN